MNYHQLKQLFQNNLIYGGNERVQKRISKAAATALLQPDYFRHWGIDDSHWGGVIDLVRAKALGCAFLFQKGLDGTLETKYYKENYQMAVSIGLPRAPYAWLYRNVNVSCVAQAQAYDSLLNRYPSINLPPVIDFEATRYGGAQSNPDFTDLRKYVTEFLRLGNPKPILYTGKYYSDQFGQIPSDLKAMFTGLWIANYSSLNPPLPFGWTDWLYHQWTSSGDQAFIAPSSIGKLELDLNYGNGTVSPQDPPDGGTMTEYQVTGDSGVNLRPSPSTSTTVIKNIAKGSKVWGVPDILGWIKGEAYQQLGGIKTNQVFYCVASLVKEVSPPQVPKETTITMTLKSDGTITGTWADK